MLHKVIIRNFRSLKDVELDLRKVNLLIGANNSGKSNFLKALKYFSGKEKGIENDVRYKSQSQDFNIPVIFYDIEIEKEKKRYFHYIIEGNDTYWGYSDKILRSKDYLKIVPKDNMNRRISSMLSRGPEENKKYDFFNSFFKNIQIYKPDPNKLLSFQNLQVEENLYEDVSNLVSFLDNMRDSKPEIIEAIVRDLKECVSNFVDIRFRKEKNNVARKQFGLVDSQNNIFWSDELSEGVLYFLAILAIIHQPNPPKILLLEEPERNVHPRRIKEIMDFIFRLSEEKNIQVIMTTHSMLVLNEFQDIPESVFVFDMMNNETIIKNLKKDIIDVSNEKSKEKNFPFINYNESLGDKWFTGLIEGIPIP